MAAKDDSSAVMKKFRFPFFGMLTTNDCVHVFVHFPVLHIVGVLLQPPIPIFHFLQETVKTVFLVQTRFISVNGLEWLGYEI